MHGKYFSVERCPRAGQRQTLPHAPKLRLWALLLLAVGLRSNVGAGVTFTPLGYVEGGTALSEAIRVSADGSVVVGLSDSATGTQAFRWTSATGMVGLGSGAAYDVSDDGSVVVGQAGGAFRWTAESGMVSLGDLPGGTDYSNALGVSQDGAVVVGSSRSTLGEEAIRWTEAEGMVGLGYPPGGQNYSTAISVSTDGSVIAGYSDLAVGGEAWRWTDATGMEGLGDLPGGEQQSAAWDVSSDGSVIVGVAAGPLGREAFRWTAGDGMVGLGHLPDGETYSHAVGVSGDGRVVVGESASAAGSQAFRWTEATGMQSLHDLLVAAGQGDALEGWTLDLAKGISADGNTIVGWGHNPDGNTEAWLVTIPNLLPGDANGDGFVTPADYTIWADHFGFGPGATPAQGDFNLDGFVNGSDYTLWADHFTGLPPGPPPAVGVPEPGAAIIAISAVLFLVPCLVLLKPRRRCIAFQTRRTPSVTHIITFLIVASARVDWTHGLGVTFLDIGSSSPGSSEALGVSGDGRVVVGYQSTQDGFEAFRWTSDEGIEALGLLPGSGPYWSAGRDASYDGSVIVGDSSYGNEGYYQGFKWTAVQGMEGLGDLPGGPLYSYTGGVSADGQVIVGDAVITGARVAARWDNDGSIHNLGTLSGGISSGASAISQDGSVIVGGSSGTGFTYAPFRWSAQDGMQRLGGSDEFALATACSYDGSVIVGVGHQGALAWIDGEGMAVLGDGAARGVSADGRIIVGGSQFSYGYRASLWIDGGTTIDLNRLLAGFGIDLSEWQLLEAQAISDDGRVIVGTGSRGLTQAWAVQIDWPIWGDANGDGFVTPADYTIWADNFGRWDGDATFSVGDFNFDGFVNGGDYTLWADNFTGLPDAIQSVPEPAPAVLAVVGACLLAAHGIRRVGL